MSDQKLGGAYQIGPAGCSLDISESLTIETPGPAMFIGGVAMPPDRLEIVQPQRLEIRLGDKVIAALVVKALPVTVRATISNGANGPKVDCQIEWSEP